MYKKMHDSYNRPKFEKYREPVQIVKEDKKLKFNDEIKINIKQKKVDEKKVFKDLRKAIEEGDIEEAVELLNK